MNDDEIGELTKADIPPRGPEYWDNIRASLDAVDEERAAERSAPDHHATVASAESDKNMETDEGVLRLSDMRTFTENLNERPGGRARVLAAAAAIIVIAGLGALAVTRLNQPVATETADNVVVTDDSAVDAGPDPDASATNDGATDNGADDDTERSEPVDNEADSSEPVETTTTTTESDQSAGDSTTTEAPTSESSDVVTTTTVASPVNQAESGLRFDYGDVTGYFVHEGVTWISFDRAGFGPDQAQGLELDAEPRYEMATDWHGGMNENPRLRTYPLSAEAMVLELDPADYEAGCADFSVDVGYVETDLDSLLATSWDDSGSLASLTFDTDGNVTLVRDQRGC